jgi:hypothetical protein
VIQAVILAELDGLNTPNKNGDRPLLGNDPRKPNEAYFAWVDKVIRKAAGKGMYIGLLPTWGDKVDVQWGTGPVIFDTDNAYVYGQYLVNVTRISLISYGSTEGIALVVAGTKIFGMPWLKGSDRKTTIIL